MKGPRLICISLEEPTLREIRSVLLLHQPRTSHKYCLCILAMFTMSHKDLKHVNRLSLTFEPSRFEMCEPLGK